MFCMEEPESLAMPLRIGDACDVAKTDLAQLK
jgi:hypothetical protein